MKQKEDLPLVSLFCFEIKKTQGPPQSFLFVFWVQWPSEFRWCFISSGFLNYLQNFKSILRRQKRQYQFQDFLFSSVSS